MAVPFRRSAARGRRTARSGYLPLKPSIQKDGNGATIAVADEQIQLSRPETEPARAGEIAPLWVKHLYTAVEHIRHVNITVPIDRNLERETKRPLPLTIATPAPEGDSVSQIVPADTMVAPVTPYHRTIPYPQRHRFRRWIATERDGFQKSAPSVEYGDAMVAGIRHVETLPVGGDPHGQVQPISAPAAEREEVSPFASEHHHPIVHTVQHIGQTLVGDRHVAGLIEPTLEDEQRLHRHPGSQR